MELRQELRPRRRRLFEQQVLIDIWSRAAQSAISGIVGVEPVTERRLTHAHGAFKQTFLEIR